MCVVFGILFISKGFFSRSIWAVIFRPPPPWNLNADFPFRFGYTLWCNQIETFRKLTHFHKPTTYESNLYTISEQMITVALHEYGQVEDFRNKMRPLVQKL